MNKPTAAVMLIIRRDGHLLAVWSPRYHGWLLPGGRVESDELEEECAARELVETTGLVTSELGASELAALDLDLVYVAPNRITGEHAARSANVFVFRSGTLGGEPKETVQGRPVRWMRPDEFLEICPFHDFYGRMIAAGVDMSPTV